MGRRYGRGFAGTQPEPAHDKDTGRALKANTGLGVVSPARYVVDLLKKNKDVASSRAVIRTKSMAALAADGPRRRQAFSAAPTSVNPSAACVHPGFETAWEATHSIGSSRDLPGQCETRTESEVGRAAQQIRGSQAVDLPVPTGQKKVGRGFYVRCAS